MLKGILNRWREARHLLQRSVLRSSLCAAGLVYLVRIDIVDGGEERGRCKHLTLHGFQSLDSVLKKCRKLQREYVVQHNREHPEEPMYYYRTFVAGHNVVHDFINGYFC